MPYLYSRHKQDQPIPLLSRGPGPCPNLDSSPYTWDPVSVWYSDLHIFPPLINQSEKSQNLRQESNKPPRSHKQVCARDNKSVTWLPSTATDGPQSMRTRKTVQPSSAPWLRDTTCYAHQYPYQIPTWSPFFFPSFYYESNNNHLLWVTLGYSRYR
jgi:hypothetical protein